MRFLILALGLALAPSIFAQSSPHPRPKDLEKLEEVPSPPVVKDSGLVPDAIVVKEGDETIKEFRVKGKLPMTRVTTSVGAAYWLADERGDGKLSRLDGPGSRTNLPMWKLIEW